MPRPRKNSPAAKAFKKVKLVSLQRLKERADRALQDWYRANYREPCESCRKPFQVMHHYVPKSQSAGLRFEPENLIFLCHGCHFRHHRTGDPDVMGAVIEERGTKWLVHLKELRQARKGWTLDRKFLTDELARYSKRAP